MTRQRDETILLGESLAPDTAPRRPFDLRTTPRRWGVQDLSGQAPLGYGGEGHLITVAPTGAGKGRSVIIPNLLSYDGPVVVTDPKGENFAVTARARRQMGHAVYKLDPFGVT